MTRDIVEINDFTVLIEQAMADGQSTEICGFPGPSIGFSFYGSGQVELEVRSKGKSHRYDNTKGIAISFYANEQVEFVHRIAPQQPLQCLCITISPAKIAALPEPEAQLFSEHVPELLNPDGNYAEGPGFYMSPEMLVAVEKIFNTAYQGAMRSMFIRSQVIELMTYFFALVSAKQQVQPMSSGERAKLYQVRDILIGNMENPPSLNALSRQVGLNSYKLKKQFKSLFGVPVFKYLQQERLDKAHKLLSSTDLSIREAAWTVGYESLSAFSSAFLKKFGVRPSELRK